MADWLADFVKHTSYGETPPRIMYWIGVCTIAGALQRKVWIEEDGFQWTPNFYLIIVAKPGVIKKSTSIGRGIELLKHVEDVDFGPQIVTWQQLITHMAEAKREVMVDGKPFEMSCVTIALSEFTSLFDPTNKELVTNLTDIWDAKIETVRKETKTMGDDEIVNPWLNIMACTTPSKIADTFSSNMVGDGFASRPIYIYSDRPMVDVAYPSRNRPKGSSRMKEQIELIRGLQHMGKLAGGYQLTEAAYAWGEEWYKKVRAKQRTLSDNEAGLYERKQSHLHKLAMVISASRGKFPVIDVPELEEADRNLQDLVPDTERIFGFVGQSSTSKAAREIIEALARVGSLSKRELFKRYFFRTMSITDFGEALKSAVASGQVTLTGSLDNETVSLKGK